MTLIRYTFHKNGHSISYRDVGTIEHLLRKGRRQVEQLEDNSVKDCWVGDEMKQWDGCLNLRTHKVAYT